MHRGGVGDWGRGAGAGLCETVAAPPGPRWPSRAAPIARAFLLLLSDKLLRAQARPSSEPSAGPRPSARLSSGIPLLLLLVLVLGLWYWSVALLVLVTRLLGAASVRSG